MHFFLAAVSYEAPLSLLAPVGRVLAVAAAGCSAVFLGSVSESEPLSLSAFFTAADFLEGGPGVFLRLR